MSALVESIEPVAAEAGENPRATAEDVALLSIAISLKRIADAVAGDNQNSGLVDMLREIDRTLNSSR